MSERIDSVVTPLDEATYERSIPAAQRLQHGQYYTPAPVCDLMLALMAHAWSGPVPPRMLEPSCGTGVFLRRAFARFANQAPEGGAWALSSRLHGIERDGAAAAVARRVLQALAGDTAFSIHSDNFLEKNAASLGTFDWVIGNPPYVRAEQVGQSEPQAQKIIADGLRRHYADYCAQHPEQTALFHQNADLYLWFFLHAATFLAPGGRLAFITSNSWLNAAFGETFRRFLGHRFHLLYLVESACERWFCDAAVNPVIVVLQKKPGAENDAEPPTPPPPARLLRFQTPLTHWLPPETSPDYWAALERQVATLPTQATIACQTVSQEALFAPDAPSWSRLLRAPGWLNALLEHDACWQTLADWGTVRYPLKTGINRFFYLSAPQARDWGIEPEFLFPVARSGRKLPGFSVTPTDCDALLFACPVSLPALAAQGKTGALAYIRWGEGQSAAPRQKRSQPIPWPQVPSVRQRTQWYTMPPLPPPHLLCPRFWDQRFCFALCEGPLMEDQTFYGLTLEESGGVSPELAAALLNSTLAYLVVEFSGRTSLGEGVLQFARRDMAFLPVPKPALYSPLEQAALVSAFAAMRQRTALPLQEELQQADRRVLDELVLKPFQRWDSPFDSLPAFQEAVAQALLARVEERRALARSVKTRRV